MTKQKTVAKTMSKKTDDSLRVCSELHPYYSLQTKLDDLLWEGFL